MFVVCGDVSVPGSSSLGAPLTGAPLDTSIGVEDATGIPAEKAGQARRSPGQTITGVPPAAASRDWHDSGDCISSRGPAIDPGLAAAKARCTPGLQRGIPVFDHHFDAYDILPDPYPPHIYPPHIYPQKQLPPHIFHLTAKPSTEYCLGLFLITYAH